MKSKEKKKIEISAELFEKFKNVEITAGSVIGGFVEICEGGYVGINSVLRNRIKIGKKAFVGMGAVVTKSVEDGITVVGNPAKPFERK